MRLLRRSNAPFAEGKPVAFERALTMPTRLEAIGEIFNLFNALNPAASTKYVKFTPALGLSPPRPDSSATRVLQLVQLCQLRTSRKKPDDDADFL